MESKTFNTEEKLSYFGIKGLLSIIFSNEFADDFAYLKEVIDIDNVNTLYVLNEIISKYQHIFDVEMKSNVHNIVDYFRNTYLQNYPNDRKEVYDIANDILAKVNVCDDKQIKEFVIKQMRIRYFKVMGIIGGALNPELAFPYLKINNVDDFHILYTHSDLVTDEEFADNFDIFTELDSDYIANISSIILEYPDILGDVTFLKRVKMVTDALGKNIQAAKEEDVEGIKLKDIKKMYKKYLHNLNIACKKCN